jgi:hypothetical protein
MLRKTKKSKHNKKKIKGGEKYTKSVRKTVKKPKNPKETIVSWGDVKNIHISPIKDKNIAEKTNLSEIPIILVIPTHGAILSLDKKPSIIDLKTDFPTIKSLIKIGFSQPGNLTSFHPQSEKYSQLQFVLDLQSRYGAKIDIPTLLEYIVTDEKEKYKKFLEEIVHNINTEEIKAYARNKLDPTKSRKIGITQTGEEITSTFDDLSSKYTIFKYVRDAIGPQQGLYDKTYSYNHSDMEVDGEIMSTFTKKMEKEFHCISQYDIDEETEDIEVSIRLYEILSCITKKYSDNNVNIIIIDTTCNEAHCELQAAPAVLG